MMDISGMTMSKDMKATSEPILSKRMLEVRRLPELLEVADPRAGKQRFSRRCACFTRTAQQLTEDWKIQNLTFPFQHQFMQCILLFSNGH